MFDGWSGEVVRLSVGELTGPARAGGVGVGQPVARPVLAGPLAEAGRSLGTARAVAREGLFALGGADLAGQLAGVDRIRQQADRLVLGLVVEAARRGLHREVELSLHDWLAGQLPSATRAEIRDLAVVVEHVDRPGHAPVRDALLDGSLPVARGARLFRALRPVRLVTDPDTYARDVQTLLGWAVRADVTDREVTQVGEHLATMALPELAADARRRAHRDLRGVNESSLADGSLTRFVITADPEGAATLRAVLTSPLAAPSPDADGPDPRTPAQRRYDALLTVIGRGVASPEGVPTTAKAKIMVTVPLDVLQDQTDGLAQTLTGELLPAGAVRKLACTADLIPAVLGTNSEVLDLGKPVRFATPAQLTVLYRRDKHCTYPGCTVPPQWCDAHHVIWYSRGGKTYLLNLALLCGRHHDLVHKLDLTATVTAFGVTWHLR